MDNNKLLLFYIAGFIDAEGCFTTHMVGGGNPRSNKKYLRAELAITHGEYEILFMIKNIFGGNIYKKKKMNTNHKDLWHYSLTGYGLIGFINKMLSLLKGKKGQAALSLSILKTKRTLTTHDGSTLDKKIIIRREKLAKKMKELKIKNYSMRNDVDYNTIKSGDISLEDFAYLAGFIDGDGFLGQIRSKKNSILCNLRLYNTNLKLLIQLQKLIGGKIKKSRNKGEGNSITTPYTLYLNAKDSKYILTKLFPFLIIKRKEALLFLEYINYDFSQQKNRELLINELKIERHKENRVRKIERYPH